MEVSEGYLTLFGGLVAKSRNEKQIAGLPSGALGLIGGGAFLDNKMAENTAEDDDGKFLFFELDEENTPRLICHQRAELLDLFDFDRSLGVQIEFFRLVVESEGVEVVRLDRPFEFIAKVFDQRRKGLDRAKTCEINNAHGSPL